MKDIKNTTDVIKRRFEIYRRKGFFESSQSSYIFRRALSIDELFDTYSLVHDVYVEKGFILPQESGLRLRIFEIFNKTATFICTDHVDILGTFGIIEDSKELRVPSYSVFTDEIDQISQQGDRKIAELTNQAILPTHRSGNMFMELTRLTYAHAFVNNCTDLICSVSPSQEDFYTLIGFRPIGTIKSASEEVFDPVLLLHLPDFKTCWSSYYNPNATEIDLFWYNYYIVDNPYIRHIQKWEHDLSAIFESDIHRDEWNRICTHSLHYCE